MKRVFALFLLALFLLNALGLYGVFMGLQFKSALEANQNLDRDHYSTQDEVTFKIPLTLAYATGSDEYTRVSGEFERQGEVYRLVKQKYSRDTLTIICVKDREARKINQAMADYVKTFADTPANTRHDNSKTVKSFGKEYLSIGILIESQASGWSESVPYAEENPGTVISSLSNCRRPPRLSCLG
jgi:hypothetical protein